MLWGETIADHQSSQMVLGRYGHRHCVDTPP